MIDYSISSNLIQKRLNFLNSIGFDRFKMMTESSSLAGDSLLLHYESSKTGRKIDISYSCAQKGRPFTFVVFLFSKDGDSFSLEDWLNLKGKKQAIKLVSDSDSNISEDDFIKEFAASFEKICRSDLKKIINGSHWESVPFDWKGYR